MDNCEHKDVTELARYTVDCGLSGTITWIRYRCTKCGKIVTDRLVCDSPTPPEPTPPEPKSKKKQKRKSIKGV